MIKRTELPLNVYFFLHFWLLCTYSWLKFVFNLGSTVFLFVMKLSLTSCWWLSHWNRTGKLLKICTSKSIPENKKNTLCSFNFRYHFQIIICHNIHIFSKGVKYYCALNTILYLLIYEYNKYFSLKVEM